MTRRMDYAWAKVDALLRRHVRDPLLHRLLRRKPLALEMIDQAITDARTVEALDREGATVNELDRRSIEAAERRGRVDGLRWAADCLGGKPELARAMNEVADGVERGEPLPPRA